ncbi:MAG: PAS domain-containing protein [Pseudomonadota bacterium]
MADTPRHPKTVSHDRLRRSARDLIDHGVPPRGRSTLSVDAMQLLYDRASTPDSAADALKLLHELQTYQVELDLLYEQLQANEVEVTEELAHYKALYDQAPAAYLIVATDGEVIEGNRAANALFGEPAMPLTGRSLFTLLAPGQDSAVTALLRDSVDACSGTQVAAKVSVELRDHRPLIISARAAAGGDSILMILADGPTHATAF